MWWVVGILLGIVFLVVFLANGIAVVTFIAKRRHVSAIPLIGGIAGSLALLALPIPRVSAYWWIPLVIDYGTLPMVAYFFLSRITASVRNL